MGVERRRAAIPTNAAALRQCSDRFQPRSQINVAPLVDVCLVLLIIFMVVTPMLDRSGGVATPATRRPQPLPETRHQLAISIQRDGNITLGCERVSAVALPAALRRAHQQDPDSKVIVRADRQLRYRDVLAAMRAARAAGFAGVGLVTRKLDQR